MKSSDLLVRSGRSSDLIKRIMQLRMEFALYNDRTITYSQSKFWTPNLASFVSQSYYFHFQYAGKNHGYAILKLPYSADFSDIHSSLIDFCLLDDEHNSFSLGAVMLSYISSYCRAMKINRLEVDYRSCENESLLLVLLRILVPNACSNNGLFQLDEQQLELLSNCVDITSSQSKDNGM